MEPIIKRWGGKKSSLIIELGNGESRAQSYICQEMSQYCHFQQYKMYCPTEFWI